MVLDSERGEVTLAAEAFGVIASFYMVMFAVPVVMQNQGAKNYCLWIRLIGPFFAVIMSLVKDGFNDSNFYGFITMNLFHVMFLTQGIVNQIYEEEMTLMRHKLAQTFWTPMLHLSFFFIYSTTCPTTKKGQGVLHFFPLYDIPLF